MPSTRAKNSAPRNAKQSFTWGIKSTEVGWMKSAAAIEGSTTCDCTASSASPIDKRRRKRPASNGTA